MVLGTKGRRTLHSCMGAVDTMLRYLFQTGYFGRAEKMSTSVLLGVAFAVFTLMITGLALTMREFQQMEDPQSRKGSDTN